ncbi:MAG: DNA polymerase III subunit alpha [Acholeplasmataceae bacterium]|nr:DNA polymerase III subunit alpha [Acholeplasmataceae bacterium]
MSYVNLYTETEYTFLASTVRLTELVKMAKEYQYQALGITDLNNMHGVLKFYNLCMANGIKPLIGLHTSLDAANSLLLYAKDLSGYRHLLAIATQCKLQGAVSLESLKPYGENLLAILPGTENEVIALVKENDLNRAQMKLREYLAVFSDLYLGGDLQCDGNRFLLERIIAFGKANSVKTVALNKTSYLRKADFDAYQVLRCIDLGLNQYLPSEQETSQSFISVSEAGRLFRDYPELLSETEAIASRCQVQLEFKNYRFPVYPDAEGKSFEYLTALCKVGLTKRLQEKNVDQKIYRQRLLYELDIIKKMGFADYFLIVYDFVKYAKKKGILVGPGRGSGPSSLVSYCLGITEIDPLQYDLLFERFLNPERISLPDIDTDFPDNRRDEVIHYVASRYGKDRVAHISAFGTFGVRLAIRDIARVMRMNDVVLNEILKFVPEMAPSMQTILDENEMFRNLLRANAQVYNLVQIVLKIEGLPRHITTHAAGIIIGGEPLVESTALQNGINGLLQTQFEAIDLEQIGLVKMDFLGIRNLTIIDTVISKIHESEPSFSLNRIPLDDKATYQMIASGDTDGIFQLESQGMRNVLQGLKTSTFMDIVNANALYRPGPREMIPSFIRRKFGQEEIDYIHPGLQAILEPTYGIIVFQEQIMLIAQKFAGYTLGMADILRKAVSKKNPEVMVSERARFVANALKNGYDEETSNKVYEYILKFASYGFNKSHSVAYSLVSYQMAYLKRHYYQHFMAVLMTNSLGSVNLIRNYIRDCRKKKVQVYGPSVNFSEDYFVVRNNAIYYSLLGIQNLGSITLKSFLEERKANGPYHNYDEFVARTQNILNRRLVESMVWAGALDEFRLPRKQMVEEYENSLNLANYSSMLGDNLRRHPISDEEYSFEEISTYERQMLGFNLKYSPLAKYQSQEFGAKEISRLTVGHVKVLFVLRRFKKIITKKNEEMAFLTIYDDTDEMDAVMFPLVFRQYKNYLNSNGIYLGEGNIEERNNKKQFVIQKLRNIR